MSLYKRLFAWVFHHFVSDHSFYNQGTHALRAELLAQASGTVLEIGVGDGANLPLYPPTARLALLEPNRHLLNYIVGAARPNAHQTRLPVEGFGEYLPFASGTFAAVVATHVLCSVQDQTRVLAEIRRVLQPGGVFIFLEHVAAPAHTPLFYFQRLIEPPWRFLADGCHLTRDTGALIRRAGFASVELTEFRADYPAFVSPHIMGTART